MVYLQNTCCSHSGKDQNEPFLDDLSNQMPSWHVLPCDTVHGVLRSRELALNNAKKFSRQIRDLTVMSVSGRNKPCVHVS